MRGVRVERGDVEPAAALLRMGGAHLVDHQPAHRARRIGEEAGAVFEGDAVALADVEPRLVDQGARAHHGLRAVAAHLAAREPAQIVVQAGEQLVRGGGRWHGPTVDENRVHGQSPYVATAG